jgi:hypothetical protein
MLEKYGFFLIAGGALLAAIAYIWLVVRAFRVRVLWGLALLIFPPSALIFIWMHFRKVRAPVVVLVLAALMVAVPYGMAYYERHFVPLKPYEQIVDGELRITLTGLHDFDYASLGERRDVVVLQMANEDVDDRTLDHLKGLDQLRKLDLSGTRITDEGLATIAELPRLQELYLARTKITDEGFRKHLLPKESLLRLDLTGTDIKGKTKREWKKLKPGEREYVD